MNNKNSRWKTEEDIERDLYEYSHLPYPVDDFTCAPPKSIAEYRARTSTTQSGGLFDDDKETPAIFVSGRGKYVKDRIIKPGIPTESIPEDEIQIKKKIREVSGLGYGNEIIQQAFAKQVSNVLNGVDETFHQADFNIPNLKLLAPTSGSSSSSSRSTTPTVLPNPSRKRYT